MDPRIESNVELKTITIISICMVPMEFQNKTTEFWYSTMICGCMYIQQEKQYAC